MRKIIVRYGVGMLVDNRHLRLNVRKSEQFTLFSEKIVDSPERIFYNNIIEEKQWRQSR